MRNAIPALFALAAVAAVPVAAQEYPAAYRHSLADFSGTIPYNQVDVHVDWTHDEILVADAGLVRVFNASGMEIYQFDVDPALGNLADVASLPDGDILLLTFAPREGTIRLVRCDYRGRYVADVVVDWIRDDGLRFRPNVLEVRESRIVLASTSDFLAAEVDLDGTVRRVIDLVRVPLDDFTDGPASTGAEITGFGLGPDGNVLYTVAVDFRAILVQPDGTIEAFGGPGSSAGKFGIVAGITQADDGTIFVADKGRNVIQAWSPDLRLIGEFGERSNRVDGLIRPTSLAVDASGRLYVTQLANRGVSVFATDSGRREG